MSEIELKNCPFCGGEAAFGTIRYSSEMVREQKWTQDVFHTVSCISCGSSTQKITGHKTQDGAAESWNTRVDPELDRLKAENRDLRRQVEKKAASPDNDLYDRLNEILLEQGDRYFDPDDMSVDGDDVLKAIITDRDKAYAQLNIMMQPFPDDEIDAIRTENCELVQRMEKLKAASGLVFAASTALSNQWCEKDLERLRELSQALASEDKQQ